MTKIKKKKRKIILFTSIGILTPILLAYLAIAVYYNNHFYSNTLINGVSTPNMTVKEAEAVINSEVNSYVLDLLGRKDINDSISGKSIDLHTEFDQNLEDVVSNQNSFAWPVSLFKQKTVKINTMLKYDEDLLKQQIDQLNSLKDANTIEPVNARISEYGENGYVIIPEDQGAKVNKEKLSEAVEKSINTMKPSLRLEDAECYEKPEIDSNNTELGEAVKKMNKIAGTKITYEFGDATEILDGSKISKWLSVDENFIVSFDEQGIKEFVDYIGKTYNSFGRERTFKTSYKKEIIVKGGDYGWWLNREKEASEITQLIKNGEQLTREPAYFQTAQQYGTNDIGDTYVEVNITAQHLFLYKEGKLILQTDIVSGNLAKKFGTPVGTYPIQYRDEDATLNGEDYSTPVKYWMPFNNNIGFHDASWRDKFGKDIYLTDGSHGCINMPPAKAKQLFANVKKGTPVVVYKLKGTENYEKKPKTAVPTVSPTPKPTLVPTPTLAPSKVAKQTEANTVASKTVKKPTEKTAANEAVKKPADKTSTNASVKKPTD